jgi:DNA-binding MurR/RpiR family transcriptional regulator
MPKGTIMFQVIHAGDFCGRIVRAGARPAVVRGPNVSTTHTEQQPADGVRNWLIERVHAHRLSPTQRRVVQYMLDSLPDVAFASTVDIAEAAGVSQPTVTRIATALGFAGYAEFRAAIREIVLGQSIGAAPGPPTSALATERQNLLSLEETVTGERMRRAIDALAGTRPLGIVGLRVSSALANYLGYFAQRVLPDVRILDDAASLDDAVTQLRLDGATAMLAFVMPRYPAATVRALTTARRLGMTTVAIVDSPLVPFSSLIDVGLVAPVSHDLVFDSHAAPIALSMALLDGLAGADPRRTQARLEAHEELVEQWELRGD